MFRLSRQTIASLRSQVTGLEGQLTTVQGEKDRMQEEWNADKQKLEEERQATLAIQNELHEKEKCLADTAQELVERGACVLCRCR